MSNTNKGRSPVAWELLPMIEAGAPSTEEVSGVLFRDVPAPLGVVMLALPRVPRNAQWGKANGRAKEDSKKSAAEGHYKGREPLKAPPRLAAAIPQAS